MTKRRPLADLIEARFHMMPLTPGNELTLYGVLSPELMRRMAVEAAAEIADGEKTKGDKDALG